jgi:hypothetical protein
MTSNNIIPATLVYNGEIIKDKGEKISLTDMWRAHGSDPARQPSNWLASVEAKNFIEVLNPGNSGIMSKRGRGGGTFAHWQIALAYAKYLSPEFHMWCNQVVRERMEGDRHRALAPPQALEQIERSLGIAKSTIHKVTNLEMALANLDHRMNEMIMAADARVAALEYVSVRELLSEAGAIQRRRGALNRKIGHDLRSRALVAGTSRPCRRCPHSGVWLFQRDFASLYMAEHGRELVIAHNERQLGQGVLKFPRKAEKPSFDGSAL